MAREYRSIEFSPRRLNCLELERVYEEGTGRENVTQPSRLICGSVKYVKDVVGDEMERHARTSPWAL